MGYNGDDDDDSIDPGSVYESRVLYVRGVDEQAMAVVNSMCRNKKWVIVDTAPTMEGENGAAFVTLERKRKRGTE